MKPIKVTIVSEEQFERERESISNENELIRCPNPKCAKLVSKHGMNGNTIQHRGIRAIIRGEMDVQCVDCGTVIRIPKVEN